MIFEILLRSKCQENCFKDHLLPFQTENSQKNFFEKKMKKKFFENFLFAMVINDLWNNYLDISTLAKFQKSLITIAN